MYMVIPAGQGYCGNREDLVQLLAAAVACLGHIASWGAQCFELSRVKAV